MFCVIVTTFLVLSTALALHASRYNSIPRLTEFGRTTNSDVLTTSAYLSERIPMARQRRQTLSVVLPPWLAKQRESVAWLFPEELCPPLQSPRLDITCMYNNAVVPCDVPMLPGTVAIERCKEFYNNQCQVVSYSLHCLEGGSWDYPLFICKPADVCKQEGKKYWTWKRESECESHKGIGNRTPSGKCNLINQDPYVCCELNYTTNRAPVVLQPADRKSVKMCKRYAEAVFQSVVLPNKVTPERIDSCALVEPIAAAAPTSYDHVPDPPRNAQPREFPHMAVIGYGVKSMKRPMVRCVGSLVSERYVISLARCANNHLGKAAWVRLGDYNVNSDSDDVNRESRTVIYDVIETIVHPDYQELHEPNEIFYHDVALYRLNTDVKFDEYVRPICLHSGNRFDQTFALNIGWGPVEPGSRPSDVVQKVNVTIVDDADCREAFKFYGELNEGLDTRLAVCAALTDGRDTCTSIDGSPLQIRLRDTYCMYSLVGLGYFGNSCFVKSPGVYVRVSYYLDWIESVVWP